MLPGACCHSTSYTALWFLLRAFTILQQSRISIKLTIFLNAEYGIVPYSWQVLQHAVIYSHYSEFILCYLYYSLHSWIYSFVLPINSITTTSTLTIPQQKPLWTKKFWGKGKIQILCTFQTQHSPDRLYMVSRFLLLPLTHHIGGYEGDEVGVSPVLCEIQLLHQVLLEHTSQVTVFLLHSGWDADFILYFLEKQHFFM